jgi:hypothetical protein
LLHCAEPEQARAAASTPNQIAKANSSNGTATRQLAGSPTAPTMIARRPQVGVVTASRARASPQDTPCVRLANDVLLLVVGNAE